MGSSDIRIPYPYPGTVSYVRMGLLGHVHQEVGLVGLRDLP
jgi:hypothetical protein